MDTPELAGPRTTQMQLVADENGNPVEEYAVDGVVVTKAEYDLAIQQQQAASLQHSADVSTFLDGQSGQSDQIIAERDAARQDAIDQLVSLGVTSGAAETIVKGVSQ